MPSQVAMGDRQFCDELLANREECHHRHARQRGVAPGSS